MEIKRTVNGDVQLSRNLRVFVTSLSKMSGFYSEAVDIVSARSDKIFSNQGSNVEKNPVWKPLAPSTSKARERRRGYYKRSPSNPSILRWTGNLQKNRTKFVSELQGALTFNAPYAIYHQEGNGRLPRRAIIDLDNKTNSEIVRALQTKIDKDIGISGLQA